MATGATNYTTITGDFPDFPSATINFKPLSSIAISGTEIFPSKNYTMTLDVNGNGSTDIPTPDGTGDLAWLWEANIPDGREQNISIAWAALSQDLATLLAAAVSTTTPSDVAQLISGKQDKDTTAIAGDMAFFDGNGNTVDAGFAMSWNATDQTVDIPLNANVTLQTGQELLVPARNNTGSTINNGDIVRFSGSTGTRQIIALAQADTTANARQIGMATENILTGTEGFIAVVGLVRNQDTSAWDEEDVLYLSPTTPGLKTNTLPIYPQILVEVGIVVRKHPTDGVIFVSAYETASGAYVKAAAAQAAAEAASLSKNTDILSLSALYEFTQADNGKTVECNGTFTLTFPDGLSDGFQVSIFNVGSGTITLAAATTLQGVGTQITAQYTAAYVYHRGSNVFLAVGALS